MILLTSCKERPIVLVCLYFTATLVIAADKELGSGRVRAKIKGRSGKVEFVQKGSDGKFDYAKAFTLEVDYVKQKDKDGGDVGKAVNSLASQDFTFSALKQNAVYQSIPAVNLNLDAFLTAPEATLKLELYIFKQAGNITFGNETFLVENGTLKILIKVCGLNLQRLYYHAVPKNIQGTEIIGNSGGGGLKGRTVFLRKV